VAFFIMRELSSDTLYYKGLAGFIIGPPLIVLFVNYFMINNVPDILKDIIYFLLLIVIITQGRLILKSRKVFYNNKTMQLKNHFTKQSEDVLLTDIISLKKAFSLEKEKNRNMFKLTYLKNTKKHTIYFFRSMKLPFVDNLDVFIGLDKLVK